MPRFRRSAFFRFAVLLPLLVSGMAALLFVPIYREAVQHIRTEVLTAIDRESWDLEVEFHEGGVQGLIAAIDKRTERELDPRAVYLLLDARDQILAGNLTTWPPQVAKNSRAWVEFPEHGDSIEGQVLPLFGSRTLLIARRTPLLDFEKHLSVQFAWAALAVFVISAIAATWFTVRVRRRLRGLADAAEDIRAGDLGRRLSLSRRGDEIDALADRFNRTFADLERLVDGVRQVSNHIAHDLRRPLTHARQHLEVLAHTSGLDAHAREAIESSLSEVDNLLGTFAALLRLARLQAGGFERGDEPLDLALIVHDAVELFAPVAAESARQIRLNVSSCPLRGDRHLLFQAIQNLIENALGHGGGDIEIRLDEHAILEVRDHGSGVPEDSLSRLSERFFRVDQARTTPGIGIGLALVRAIAELHGGEVRFANAHPGLRVRVRFAT